MSKTHTVTEISEDDYRTFARSSWVSRKRNVCRTLPKRMGFCDGPGANLYEHECFDGSRTCSITNGLTTTQRAHFIIRDAGDTPHYFFCGDITLAEFKALCELILPGVGPCAEGWGADL